MNKRFMGWFVRLTSIEWWLSITILLMIETFYEVFLTSILGLNTLVQVPGIALKLQDRFSVALNFLFWLFILSFLSCTLWFTFKVRN